LKPKIHYDVHKCPPIVPILNQLLPVHKLPSYFPKIYFNIILPYTSIHFPSGLSRSRFWIKNPYEFVTFPMRSTWPTHLIIHYLITITLSLFSKKYFKRVREDIY
jgi:hypothetical protein